MDRASAKNLLHLTLTNYGQKPFSELLRHVGSVTIFEVEGDAGVLYRLHIQILRDALDAQTLRLEGAIDEGGWAPSETVTESITVRASELR